MHDAGLDVAEIAELLTELEPAIDYLNLTVGMRSAYVRDMATETPPLLATHTGVARADCRVRC